MSAQGTVSIVTPVDARQAMAELGEVQRRLGATVRYMALRAIGAGHDDGPASSRVVART